MRGVAYIGGVPDSYFNVACPRSEFINVARRKKALEAAARQVCAFRGVPAARVGEVEFRDVEWVELPFALPTPR